MRIEDRGISWSLYVELRGAKTGYKVYTKGRQVFAGCDDELWRKKNKIHGTEEQVYISQTKQTRSKRWGSGSEELHQSQIIHNFFCNVSYKNVHIIDQYVKGP